MWRCHYYTAEALQMFIEGHVQHGIAMLCQLMKAQHQAAINQGSWDIAVLLLPTEDPLGKVEFGGDAEEMIRIQGHRRAMRDLRVSMNRTPETAEPDQPPATGGGGKAKGKARGKKWKKQEEEEEA